MKRIIATIIATLGIGAQAEEMDPQKYIAQSYSGLQDVTQAHSRSWGLGQEINWGVDQSTGLISFIFEGGKKAEAPVQIIGTYSSSQGTFMWGWEHPSVQPSIGEAAALVKNFGEEHGLSKLTSQPVKLTEQEAWEFTALAMRLSNANGAYRANAGGGTWVYMTFGKVSLSQNP
ncbi:hypothetical protein PS1M3_17460 [Pseudoalteromonas sp. PS1M3]|uniref:DUF6882 domain-containing protein n=1 Tax=Pseudoalteromonas sp. PS1M3 TaxID=87791 RepID=UPI00194DF50A|nr:DUF6882 domain-containing protein [Pseudoalteromonas sp. PS1M3]BBW91659.1 hypothetical protein PS1M3_17460 [Pseudoalteromonas sp. PS1M3]